jgi:hypothetical protein
MDQIKVTLVAGLILSTLCTTPAMAMTAVEAFQYLGVQHQPFNVQDPAIPDEERPFLNAFFNLIEEAVLQRVETMRQLEASRDPKVYANEYQAVESRIKELPVPTRLRKVHKLVIEGIGEQRAFIEVWRGALRNGKPINMRTHRLVRSSSAKLQEAYATLMTLYPTQGKNREAMYSHLCALDFV